MEDRLIVVSADSHAGVPKELWTEYLPERYHELLPALRADNVIYPTAIYLLGRKNGSAGFPEHLEAHRSEYHGLYDPVLRLADMDREGITAELIYHGDFRLGDMFHNVTGRDYGRDSWEAGAQGWNRWCADTFGFAMERFLVTGAIGPCVDMDVTVAELEWIADHKFAGTYGPGYMHHADMPPLFDAYWEPFWSTCAARGLAVVAHAGFGTEHGHVFPQLERIYNAAADAAGSTEQDALFAHADAVPPESGEFFNNFLNHNVDSRRPMWQLMLGGVFDRHPNLKFMPTEIRLDWIPATLRYLDKIYDEHRSDLPAKRKPSEYWSTNCLAGASFIHKAEVEMRHEIGVETIAFGRDFPHPEGTWPHTKDFLRLAFDGVPDDEVRLMLGENAIRFLELDRDRLNDIAKRIGPSIEEVNGGAADVRPELIENFGIRSGFDKPAEGEAKIPMVDVLVREDLAMVGAKA
jgi:predicted TIM-barrel fold metal-dependent hydrolase